MKRLIAKGDMRKLSIGEDKYTVVLALDSVNGIDGEYNEAVSSVYKIETTDGNKVCDIKFQRGPIGEYGINGCHQEDLIAICLDRLKVFQSGKFACRENSLAITKLEEALHWLNHRTKDRSKRGVEGTDKE